MSAPNSGTPEPNVASGSLGDISKLEFLNSIPMEESSVTEEAPAPEGRAHSTGSTDKVSQEPDAGDIEVPPLDISTAEPGVPASAGAEPAAAASAKTAEGVVSAAKGGRDYTGIDPADVPHFKQMSNTAFEAAKKWYTAQRSANDIESKYNKELNELREYKFYQHPEAYKLSPDYSKAAQEFRTQAAIINHYTRALERLEAGEAIQDIGLDDKGNPVIVPGDIPASPALKAQVSVALQRAMSAQHTAQSQLEGLSTKYTAKSTEFDQFLNKATDALVSPNLLQDKTYSNLYNKYLTNVIPPHLQNVPVYKQLAKMAAFVQLSAAHIATLQKKSQTATAKQQAARQQGPGDGLPSNGNVSIDDLPAADVLKEFAQLRRY